MIASRSDSRPRVVRPAHFARCAAVCGLFGAAVLVISSAAQANPARSPSRYVGPHPIPTALAGQFCHLEALHAHTYKPAGEATRHFVFRSEHKAFEFVGDPSRLGFEGPLIAYRGPHPVDPLGIVEGQCERRGEHLHLRAPVQAKSYESRDGSFVHIEGADAKSSPVASSDKFADDVASVDQDVEQRKRARRRERRRARHAEPSELTAPPPVVETASAPAPAPRKKVFRSWMDRRRGR